VWAQSAPAGAHHFATCRRDRRRRDRRRQQESARERHGVMLDMHDERFVAKQVKIV